MRRFWCLLALVALLAAGCAPALAPPGTTVERVDLVRYAGPWYEIASTQPWFQRGCVCTMAQYLLHGDELVVQNTCRDGGPEGDLRRATGRGRALEGGDGAQLAISFWWPWEAGYWILALDPDYRWAVVGAPSQDHLWVLSRQRTMDPAEYLRAVAIARDKGWPADRLVLTEQPCP